MYRGIVILRNNGMSISSIRKFALSNQKLETHYEVLNVPRNANLEELKKSFINLSKKYHPDKHHGDEKMHEKFVRLNEAYSVLTEPEKRAVYNYELMKNDKTYSSPMIRRSKDYKSPYRDVGSYTTDWTDFYSTYGGGKAQRDMRSETESEFWNEYRQHTKKFGGGEHEEGMSPPPKPIRNEIIALSAFLIAIHVWGMFHLLGNQQGKDHDAFDDEHMNWLMSQKKK